MILLAFVCVSALAAAPATQPAVLIRAWFDQLADPVAEVREQAHDHLLELASADLPILREIVRQIVPLRPSQINDLQDVVRHVYLSGIPYKRAEGNPAFIGIAYAQSSDPVGMQINQREIGFPGYRALHEGDVIVGIEQLPGMRFGDAEVFKQMLQTFKAGQIVILNVNRTGRDLRVKIELAARPDGLNTTFDTQTWEEQRQELADRYWDENFSSFAGNGLF